MSNSIKDIDDVDDDLFISKKPQNYIFAEKKAQDLNEKINGRLINARSLIEESKQVGQKTLENLSTQREALERAESGLDHINSTTRSTQKHLNHMKSFFGGIKSVFWRSPPAATSLAQNSLPNRGAIPKSATFAHTPSSIPSTTSTQGNHPAATSSQQNASFAQPSASVSKSANPNEDEFEAGLSELGFGLGMLKDMALQMGEEIGSQDDMLNRITEKSERAGDSIKHQNRQMQQLLKKG